MKFKTVLLGHVITVRRVQPRYTVVLQTLTFTDYVERRTLFGAYLAARQLAKDRDNGWAERAVSTVYDKRSGLPLFGFKCSQEFKVVNTFVKF